MDGGQGGRLWAKSSSMVLVKARPKLWFGQTTCWGPHDFNMKPKLRTRRKKHQVCVRSSGQKCWEHQRGHILKSLEANVSGSCPGEEGESWRFQDKELWDQTLLSHCRNRLVKEDGLGLGELKPQRQHEGGGCTAALPRMVCWGGGHGRGLCELHK